MPTNPWWTWLWPLCLGWFVVGLAWGIYLVWMIDHG